jgi:hypothetical protein
MSPLGRPEGSSPLERKREGNPMSPLGRPEGSSPLERSERES